MSKVTEKIPKRGEIWLIDYNYKVKKSKEKELEIVSYLKKLINRITISNSEMIRRIVFKSED